MYSKDEIDKVKDTLEQMEREIAQARADMKGEFADIRLHLAIASVDEFMGEPEVFQQDVLPNAKWEHVKSYRPSRKCLLSKERIQPFSKAFKGTLTYNGRYREVWVSEEQMVFYKLKEK